MNKPLIANRNLISFGVPLFLFGILVFIIKYPPLIGSGIFSFAITADLLLTVPLIYFLLIRKTTIPKTTVIPVMIVGLCIGSYFLPKDSQTYLALFKTWALPVIELSILAFVIIKVRSAIKKYKSLKASSPDFYDVLKNTCHEVLPKQLVLPFATEVAVIYYGFIQWKARTARENEFTYHKKSAARTFLGAFIFIIAVETFFLHLLLAQWNIILAWILSGLSIYTAIQILGIMKSLSKRPVSIDETILNLRYGILSEVEIPFSDIETIEFSKKPIEQGILVKTLSPLGALESHNIILSLKKESILTGMYGIKKKFKVLVFHIDEPAKFEKEISQLLYFQPPPDSNEN